MIPGAEVAVLSLLVELDSSCLFGFSLCLSPLNLDERRRRSQHDERYCVQPSHSMVWLSSSIDHTALASLLPFRPVLLDQHTFELSSRSIHLRPGLWWANRFHHGPFP